MSCRLAAVLAFAAATVAAPALAGPVTTIPLPDNISMLGWTDGSAYAPLFDGGVHTLGGVPFQVGNADLNAVYLTTVTVNTSVAGARTAYSLVNSAVGTLGYTVGWLTFHGSAGASYTYNYVEGLNVRDHFYGGFVNTTTSPDVTQAVYGSPNPGSAHLDMQTIALPAAFATQTLTSVDIAMVDQGGGRGVIAGLSIAAVPEPSTAGMLLLGLGVFAAGRRLRARTR
ncbi:MAG: PEP-CTERM sorting domain-containing protein [Telluria sp.]